MDYAKDELESSNVPLDEHIGRFPPVEHGHKNPGGQIEGRDTGAEQNWQVACTYGQLRAFLTSPLSP